MIQQLPGDALVVSGVTRRILAQALVDAQRWRARNGLAPLQAYATLAGLMSPDGHADIASEPVGQPEGMSIHEAAAALGITARHARRLAPRLGRKVAGVWVLDRAAVLEVGE